VWSVKSATPTSAKVVIVRVEPWNGTRAIHVSIVDIPIPPDLPGAGGTTTIGHMPFDETALAASVDRLLGTGGSAAPNFEAGYQQWASAKGGIFTIGVPEAIEAAFEAMKKASGHKA
jgi:hypothetical protein